MLCDCQVISYWMWIPGGKVVLNSSSSSSDKYIYFYCTPLFYSSPFSIEHLGRFGARGSLASNVERGADMGKLCLNTDNFLEA
jgi:hypothetical protein